MSALPLGAGSPRRKLNARLAPVLVSLVSLSWGGSAFADGVTFRGEVEAYVESGRTNFAGDYNTNRRGRKYWESYFGNGLSGSYSFTETRIMQISTSKNCAETEFDTARNQHSRQSAHASLCKAPDSNKGNPRAHD